MNPDYITRAQAGTYPRSSLREVPEALRELHFEPRTEKGPYAVAERLKRGIIWKLVNLLSDPPGSNFQLIFLRNSLLTYYVEELKVPAFEKVVHSLAQGGFLIIGAHESIPSQAKGLLTFGGHRYVFQKGA